MADSAQVDAAQAAGFTVASTTGIVSGPLTAGALHRLLRIVETADGEVVYNDGGVVAEYIAFGSTPGKGIRFYAKDGAGTAGNAKHIVLTVPVDDNAPHALAVTDDETTVTVSLQVDTDGSTILSTAADVVAAVNTHDDEIYAELYEAAATRESLAKTTFTDLGTSAGDNLILTGKIASGKFSCDIREPKPNTTEAGLTSVTVSVGTGNRILIIVPLTKTIANVKTAIEAHTAANALVTVTTAGTTTHAVDVSDGMRSQIASRANRGTALATTFTTQALAGGVDANDALRIVPAVA